MQTTRNITYETDTSDTFPYNSGVIVTKDNTLPTRCIDCPAAQRTKMQSQLGNKEHHDKEEDVYTKQDELPCRLSRSEATFTFWKDIMIAIWATTP